MKHTLFFDEITSPDFLREGGKSEASVRTRLIFQQLVSASRRDSIIKKEAFFYRKPISQQALSDLLNTYPAIKTSKRHISQVFRIFSLWIHQIFKNAKTRTAN